MKAFREVVFFFTLVIVWTIYFIFCHEQIEASKRTRNDRHAFKFRRESFNTSKKIKEFDRTKTCLRNQHSLDSVDKNHTNSKIHENVQDTFQIHILTMNRASSLKRLLKTLEHTEYGLGKVEIMVHVDKNKLNQKCVDVLDNFLFSHGNICYIIQNKTLGLRDSWFNAWYPTENQRAIILEDDIELSPQWYRWVQGAWDKYERRSDIAGISLQRQILVPQLPQKDMQIVNKHVPFLYNLVGSIGFSPNWKVWSAFLDWIECVDPSGVDIHMPQLITSQWFYQNPSMKTGIWTQYFIWFCHQHDLYTLYVNLPHEQTLGAHMREKGVHSHGSQGRDFEIATKVDLNFPDMLWKYGWDGNPNFPAMYNDKHHEYLRTEVNLKPIETIDSVETLLNLKLNAIVQKNSSFTSVVNDNTLFLVLKLQANNGFVNLQLLNTGYVNMTKSWICNVRVFPEVLSKTLFVTTDEYAYNELTKFDSRLHVSMKIYNTKSILTYDELEYYQYMQFRTNFILELLENNITVWLTEADAVWWNDPSEVVLNSIGDIVTMNDQIAPLKKTQGGFQLLRSTPDTIRVWKKLIATLKSSLGDEQALFNDIISTETHLKFQWLDSQLFISGKYYNKNLDMLLKPNYFIETQYMVILNNWIWGNDGKEERAKSWGSWFLGNDAQCIV